MYWRLLIVLSILIAWAPPAGAQSSTTSNVYIFPLFADGTAAGTSYRSTLKMTRVSGSTSMQCTVTQRNTHAAFTGAAGDFYPAYVTDAGFSPAAESLVILDSHLPF